MLHDLHRPDCPCTRCAPAPHPSEARMGLRGILSALPMSATLWALILLAANHFLSR